MYIGKIEIFKSILLLIVYSLLFVFFNQNIIFASTYNCGVDEYCYDTGPNNLEISIPYYTCSNGTCVNQSQDWMTNCTWNGGSSCTQSTEPVRGYYSYAACVDAIKDVCLNSIYICKENPGCNFNTGFCNSPISNRECSSTADCCTSGNWVCTDWGTQCGSASTIEAGTCCRPGTQPPSCTVGCSACTSGVYASSSPLDSYKSGTCTYSFSDCSTETRNCWSDCNDCNPTDPICPLGTSTSNIIPTTPLYPQISDLHSTPTSTCDRTNGVSTNNCIPTTNTESISCYCASCTPSSCGPTFSASNLSFGKVPDNLTPSCRRGLPTTPNQTTLCNMTYRDCYCYSCLKQCPTPLLNTGNSKLILNDFRECTNDCSVKPPENQDDCYEIESPQPEELLTIVKDPPSYANHYGFSSITHTGDRLVETDRLGTLNDPFNPPVNMKAEYKDANGASDIEGMFVWFRGEQYTGELITPLYISDIAEPKVSADDSWGFMLRKNGTSDWDPYVPSYQEDKPSWTKAIYTTTLLGYRVFYISGPNAKQMVEVTILKQPLKEGDKVTMEFSLRFSNNEGILYDDPVAEGKYNIYLMGLDKFSFTPYDNYDIEYGNFWSEGFKYNGEDDLSPFWQPSQLRYKPEHEQLYARDWTDAGKTWTIDRMGPYIEAFAFGVSEEENKLAVHWNVNDDRSLYAVVGNIYTTEVPLSREITLSTDNINILLHDPNSFFPGEAVEENIGKLNGDWSFKVNPDINSLSNEGTLYIDVDENTAGRFEIYLTVFDDAGNISSENISIDIADWFATGGGVAYSAGGSNFSTKNINININIEGSPILSLPYPSSNPGLSLDKADSSSELWAEAGNSDPVALIKSLVSKSYNITRYLGYKLTTEGYYDYLKKEYEMNKKNIDNLKDVSPESPDLSGSLNDICNSQPYCMFDYAGDLNVKNDVVCNNQSVIFVGGDLYIDTPIKNTEDNKLSNKNGCIFVVKGNVTMRKGVNMSSADFGYDIVHGYILADGVITIDDERPKEGIIDGVYINGGLSSSYKEGVGIIINRYLRVEEKLTYPVLVIDYHPKYGVIAENFFGRKVVIKSTEVGVKP